MHSTFVGVADGPVIALAQLRLGKAGLKMACTSRTQAINILRSVRPAIAKTTPLARVIKPVTSRQDLCRKCHQPILFGTPCKVSFSGEIMEHINCAPSKELVKLFDDAIDQISIR